MFGGFNLLFVFYITDYEFPIVPFAADRGLEEERTDTGFQPAFCSQFCLLLYDLFLEHGQL
jgi:hypothetical protein